MEFKNEKDFEDALIIKLTKELQQWDANVLEFKSEEELILNFKKIIEKNNNQIDRLNGFELTSLEMKQIIDYFDHTLKTPFKINQFLNGDPTITIKRDNPKDIEHLNKNISLEIFNKKSKAGGNSVYQIARQPFLKSKYNFKENNRGDLFLLINGMPLIQIELKNNSVNTNKIKEAFNQIKRYKSENVYTGLFSLVQLFVIMTPNNMKYFANVDDYQKFDERLTFNWADENNIHIKDWREIASKFLSIPRAHDMITFYSVADESDNTLKILRSYQCYAVEKILNKVREKDWTSHEMKGGYIYHTTGSGKTLTCFKVAQIISSLTSVDKIVFLLDEIQLFQQTYRNFNSFSVLENVEDTKNTSDLSKKLKSNNKEQKIIITSIQKMSNIVDVHNEKINYRNDVEKIKEKKIVFIVDEAHRSTNGTMLSNIKASYKNALFFGFTGTPIFKENAGLDKVTTDGLFGEELHRYTMLSAIEDGNVLEVKNCENISTLDFNEIKKEIAKYFINDEELYFNFINNATQLDIETVSNWAPALNKYYESIYHKTIVVKNIVENFFNRSYNGKFHHIFTTTSIKNAVEYYRLFKKYSNDLNVAITFHPDETNSDDSIWKTEAIEEIINDFKIKFNYPEIRDFLTVKNKIIDKLKKDLPKEERIDIVIVVDQLLTGFDSKYINYVYLDRTMTYEHLIQTISRTNRTLNNSEKEYGHICCFQRTELMKENLKKAAELFINPQNKNFFESKLKENLILMNEIFSNIKELFFKNNIDNFSSLPDSDDDKHNFANLFIELQKVIYKSIPELFNWKEKIYYFNLERTDQIIVEINEENYKMLELRYSELPKGEREKHEIYINIKPTLSINSGFSLDKENLNVLFKSYHQRKDDRDLGSIEKEFYKLSIMDQNIIKELLLDIQNNNINLGDDFDIDNYIYEYKQNHKAKLVKQIHKLTNASIDLMFLLLDKNISSEIELIGLNEFTKLRKSIDENKTLENIKNILNKNIEKYESIEILIRFFRYFLVCEENYDFEKLNFVDWVKNNS